MELIFENKAKLDKYDMILYCVTLIIIGLLIFSKLTDRISGISFPIIFFIGLSIVIIYYLKSRVTILKIYINDLDNTLNIDLQKGLKEFSTINFNLEKLGYRLKVEAPGGALTKRLILKEYDKTMTIKAPSKGLKNSDVEMIYKVLLERNP